jgi:hypothetical protein
MQKNLERKVLPILLLAITRPAPIKHAATGSSSSGYSPQERTSPQGVSCAGLQVLQWTFAGAPGHPALREICDHIARSTGTAFSASTNIDTLERTGPGIWTDTVLKHARAHPPSKVQLQPRRCCHAAIGGFAWHSLSPNNGMSCALPCNKTSRVSDLFYIYVKQVILSQVGPPLLWLL